MSRVELYLSKCTKENVHQFAQMHFLIGIFGQISEHKYMFVN